MIYVSERSEYIKMLENLLKCIKNNPDCIISIKESCDSIHVGQYENIPNYSKEITIRYNNYFCSKNNEEDKNETKDFIKYCLKHDISVPVEVVKKLNDLM
jgi:hypothetical protein